MADEWGLWLIEAGGVEIAEWLESYDPDALEEEALRRAPHGFTSPYGGLITTTRDPKDAKRFPSMQAALEEWRRVSTRRPLRPDGRPNRPLAGFTVTPTRIP